MKRTILLIAIIALASCSLRANVDYMRNQLQEHYNELKQYQDQVQDLAAAAAAKGAAADPAAVVDTINGLTEAAKFWGSFIGKQVFNTDELDASIKNLEGKRSKLQEYASTDGTQALVQLNQAIWSVSVNVKSIQALATQLKNGAENVKMITDMVFEANVDVLEGNDKAIYQAAIRLLLSTLSDALENVGTCLNNFETLASQLIGIESTMQSIGQQLQNTADGKSAEYEQWVKDQRAKVYGGCVASLACGPLCVATCYSVGAGVLESEIAKYRRATEAFCKEFKTYADSFKTISTMAGQASHVAKEWYGKTQDFKSVIKTEYQLITDTKDVLYMKARMRQMISDSLDKLITECESVINDSTGQLAGNLHSQIDSNSELVSIPHPNELHTDEIAEQLCTKLYMHKPVKRAACVAAAKDGVAAVKNALKKSQKKHGRN